MKKTFPIALAVLGLLVAVAASPFPITADPIYISGQTRQTIITVFSLVILAASALTFFISGAHKGEEKGLWQTSVVFTALCFIGIGAIWYMVLRSSPDEKTPEHYKPIRDEAGLQILKDEQSALATQSGTEQPIFIPTGVLIQSLEFISANNVTISGYVWQRYAADIPADIDRGFLMPEGDNIEGTEAYRIRQGNEEVIGWYIQTTLRQTFDYARYPFDRQDIWLRLWHTDFARNVILVPDFQSYHVSEWDPYIRLGLEHDFVLERLSLERTYFNYHFNSYDANFGINNYIGQNAFPELYFNVGVRREVLDAFVAYMIPMIILILMAFGVQFIVTQISEKMSMYGISTIGLIGYFASLFFIGILAQLDIRRTLNAPGVVYVEYFYFILYAILLLQTVNAVAFTVSDNFHFIEYKDNLYPKVIFFPITLGLMFIITAVAYF